MGILRKISQITSAPPVGLPSDISRLWEVFRDVWVLSHSLFVTGPQGRTTEDYERAIEDHLSKKKEIARDFLEEFFDEAISRVRGLIGSFEALSEKLEALKEKLEEEHRSYVELLQSTLSHLRGRLEELANVFDVERVLEQTIKSSLSEAVKELRELRTFFGVKELSDLSSVVSRLMTLRPIAELDYALLSEAYNSFIGFLEFIEGGLLSAREVEKSLQELDRSIANIAKEMKEIKEEFRITREDVNVFEDVERISRTLLGMLQEAVARATPASRLFTWSDFREHWKSSLDQIREALESFVRDKEGIQEEGEVTARVEELIEKHFSNPFIVASQLHSFSNKEEMLRFIKEYGPSFFVVKTVPEALAETQSSVLELIDRLLLELERASDEELRTERMDGDQVRVVLMKGLDRAAEKLSRQPNALSRAEEELSEKARETTLLKAIQSEIEAKATLKEKIERLLELLDVPIQLPEYLFTRGALTGDTEKELLEDLLDSEKGKTHREKALGHYIALLARSYGTGVAEGWEKSLREAVDNAFAHLIIDLILRAQRKPPKKTSSLRKIAADIHEKLELLFSIAEAAKIDVSALKEKYEANRELAPSIYQELLNNANLWVYIHGGVNNVLSPIEDALEEREAAYRWSIREELEEEEEFPLPKIIEPIVVEDDLRRRLTPLEFLTLMLESQGVSRNKDVAAVVVKFFGEEAIKKSLEQHFGEEWLKGALSRYGTLEKLISDHLLDTIKKSRGVKVSQIFPIQLDAHSFPTTLDPYSRDYYFWVAVLRNHPELNLGRSKEEFIGKIQSYRTSLEVPYVKVPYVRVEPVTEKHREMESEAYVVVRDVESVYERLEKAYKNFSDEARWFRGVKREADAVEAETLRDLYGVAVTFLEDLLKRFGEASSPQDILSIFRKADLHSVIEKCESILKGLDPNLKQRIEGRLVPLLESLRELVSKETEVLEEPEVERPPTGIEISVPVALRFAPALGINVDETKAIMDTLLDICSEFIDEERKTALTDALQKLSDEFFRIAKEMEAVVDPNIPTSALAEVLRKRTVSLASLASIVQTVELIETYREREKIFRHG